MNFSILNYSVYKNITVSTLFKMLAATVAAFIFKFIVDKFVIFQDNTKELSKNIKAITIYTLFAIFTTLIFWLTQISFRLLFNHIYLEYFGAVTGLTAGFTVKYLLDKKYVFISKNS